MSAAAKPLVLGLCGPAGAGKDTAATYLEDQYAFTVIGFADPMLDMLGALAEHVDVGGEWLIERSLKEQPMPILRHSYRALARGLGTGWGREQVSAELWVRIAAYKLLRALDRGENVLVTDVRYLNEAHWLASMGGRLVGLARDGAQWRPGEHSSEADGGHLPLWRSISNNSSWAHMYDQLDTVVDALRRESAAGVPA